MAVTAAKRFRIFERDGFQCRNCGHYVGEAQTVAHIEAARRSDGSHKAYSRRDVLSIDHIWPLSAGGTDADDNLQTLCLECNTEKADRLPADAPKRFVTRKAKKAKPKDEPRLRLGAQKPLSTFQQRVHKEACHPVWGCVHGCPVDALTNRCLP
jgi:5-methylcytosine-specific restriction endonuclease McrA